jgi:predicted lipoprotein with Yx(FWY)xxD motif
VTRTAARALRAAILGAAVTAGAGCGVTTSQPGLRPDADPPISGYYVQVSGQRELVLYAITKSAGKRALYYNVHDTASAVTCTGTCASIWPPLLASELIRGPLPPATGAPGKVTFINGGNAKQAEYNGHPLYMYSGDADGQPPHGNGIKHQWYLATTGMKQSR